MKEFKTTRDLVLEEILEEFREKIEFKPKKDFLDYETLKIILEDFSSEKTLLDPLLSDLTHYSIGPLYDCIPVLWDRQKALSEIVGSLREKYKKMIDSTKKRYVYAKETGDIKEKYVLFHGTLTYATADVFRSLKEEGIFIPETRIKDFSFVYLDKIVDLEKRLEILDKYFKSYESFSEE